MSSVRVPGSLRRIVSSPDNRIKPVASRKESKAATLATAALLTAASPVTIAIAQGQGRLPPLSVETTQTKKKDKAASAAKSGKTAQPEQPASGPVKDANPYADPNAPYKVDRSASGKFTEPLVNTPQTVTAVPKEVIDDTAVKSIRELARQVPGVTLGFAEGGNAFGDRIYIRGFDARGDIYVDGIRDPGSASREVFSVQQVEIYKGPASSVAGRSTAGGAVNIGSKKPNETDSFFNVSQMFGTDRTFRTTVDVNQVLGPGLAVRGNLLFHSGEVAGRDFVEDERWGGFLSAAIMASESVRITLDYYRYRTDGLPDFGVPLNTTQKLPWTEFGLPRTTWFGNADRDFMKNAQDVFTATLEAKLSEHVKLTSRTRFGTTTVDYLASGPNGVAEPVTPATTINVGNPNRFQETDLFVHQTELAFKFDTASWKHSVVAGIEVAREDIGRYSHVKADGSGGLSGTPVSLFDPDPSRTFDPYKRYWSFDATVDTKAAYILDTVELSMDAAEWIDGRGTAGPQSASVKRNMQLPEGSPAARELGDMVLDALARSPVFISAAIPLRIFPPLFNRYGVGQSFGTHVDGAIRAVPGTSIRIRTDLSVTLFLAEPEEYEGGELAVEDKYGTQEVKLPAGDLVLYPSTSLHHVKPVSRGARVASFFWLQSMVRDDSVRSMLFDLDQTIQELTAERGLEDPACVRLTGIYHNLIRYWADA